MTPTLDWVLSVGCIALLLLIPWPPLPPGDWPKVS